ncbi:hypothetical protein DHW03_07800 [Pedobacter yonginense]|uniref:Secretion system C-terminal sorting domain-containing protein n=1 Tax=Pedobacter yonginense TaxID=651869 RepID=A0A317EMV5_9SPHI|nr:gliding motility-associated C-terminal domain-containing protein [Pedobacter yonginense]PWS27497.1 hypothetical protein DHW03_07800 [Pedobacter yonginense]
MNDIIRLGKTLMIIAFLMCVASFSKAANYHWNGNSSFVVKSNLKAPSKAHLSKNRSSASFVKKALVGKTMFWIGGGGNWNDPEHWSFTSKGTSAGRIPTDEDDVVFNSGSFGRIAGYEINVAKGGTCRNITFDDPKFEAILYNGTLNITGSANFTGASRILSNLNFSGTSSHTITSGTICIFDSKSITFSGSGSYTLQDDFRCGQTAGYSTIINHNAGTLNTNGKLLKASAFKSNSFPIGTSRALNISNSTIELTDQNAWNLTRLNLTSFRVENSLIRITAPDGLFSTVQGDNNVNTTAIAYGDVSFTAKTGTANLISTSTSASFLDVSFASNAKIEQGTSTSSITQNYYLTEGDTYTFTAGATFSILNAINTPKSACGNQVRIQSSIPGLQTNLKKDASPFTIVSANLTDVNVVGSILNVFNGSSLGNVTNAKFDNANPVLALSSSSASTTTCINKAITPITYNVSSAITASVSNLPVGVKGVYTGDNLTISGTPISSGSFTYTVTATNGCSTTTTTGNITVNNELLTLTSGTASQTVCINTPIKTISYLVSNSTSATVTGLPEGLKGLFSNGNFTISGTPTASGTFDYMVTTSAGCSQATGKITVNADLITLTSTSASQVVCINKAIAPISYSISNATGASISGLPAGVKGVFNAGKFTISGTPTARGTFDYAIVTTGGCKSASATGNITVNADFITLASGTASQIVCVNTSVSPIVYSVSNATGVRVTGLPAGVQGVYTADNFTISGTPTSSGSFAYTVLTTGGCSSASLKGTINVTPSAALSLSVGSASQTVCINRAINNITYSLSNATAATVTGLPDGVAGIYDASKATLTISGTPTSSGAFPYTVSTIGGCSSASLTGNINITPNTTLSLSMGAASQTVCVNKPISNIIYTLSNGTGAIVTGLPNGLASTYDALRGVLTISGTPATSGTFDYVITASGGCLGATATGKITVNADLLTLTNGLADQVVCVKTPIETVTYSVSNASGATVIGLPAGVKGVYSAGNFTISGTPTSSGTFRYTVTTTGGCSSASLTGKIDVTTNATLALSNGTASQTVCINKAINSITYTASNAAGATVTGLPEGITSIYDASKGTLAISGTPTSSGSFTYSVSTIGGCSSASLTGTINVTPNASLTLNSAVETSAQIVCVNKAINNIIYSLSNATSATVTGLPAGVRGVLIAGKLTISGTPTSSGTSTYLVNTIGGCSSASLTGTIDVTPNATLTLNSGASTQTACINSTIANIVYKVGGSATGATVSGLPLGVTGVYSEGDFTINGIPTSSGKFDYTVSTTGGCSSASLKGTLNVSPIATLTLNTAVATTAQTLCVNRAISGIIYSISNANSATVTGLPAGVTGAFSKGTITIIGTPTSSGSFTYTVSTIGGCSSASLTGTINVKPNARITLNSSSASQSVCNNTGMTPILYSLSNVTSATVSGLPAGINGVYSEGTFTISGTPTSSGSFKYVLNASGDCSTVSSTGTITVLKRANLSLISDPTTSNQGVCINSTITRITYAVGNATGASVSGLPEGLTGAYSDGQFVIAGIARSLGTFEYIVSSTGGCSSASSKGIIVVKPNAKLTLSSGEPFQTVCNNTAIAPIVYSVSDAPGAKVSGLPVGVSGVYSDGKFTISGTPTASGVFDFTVVNAGGCRTFELTGTLTVTKNATISLNPVNSGPASQTVCVNTEISQLVYTVTNATGVSVSGLPDGVQGQYRPGRFIISGVPRTVGTFDFVVVTTGGCSTEGLKGTIVVDPNSSISLTSGEANQVLLVYSPIKNITYTIENAFSATVTGLPAGVNGVYKAGKFTISGTPQSNGTYNFKVTTEGGCTSETASGSITVSPRAFYWVGNSGNWSDGSHWSAISGGPASGEVPTENDDVFFDGNSFSVVDSKVTLIADANCRSMTWNADAATKEPQFLGDYSLNLNIYGNLELAKGMLYLHKGNTNMRGSSLAANGQTIKTNGAELPDTYLYFYNGRFDLLDDITFSSLRQMSGQFYSNGHTMTSDGKGLVELVAVVEDSNPNSRFDISGSKIITDNYRSLHNRAFNYKTTNSTINTRYFSVTSDDIDIVYNDVNFLGYKLGFIKTFSPALLSFRDVKVEFADFTFDALNLRFNNLTLQASASNKFKPAGTFVIDGVLTADGTPCQPTELRSDIEGSRYTLKSTMKNFDLKSVHLRDAIAGNGSASENKFSGVDGGNNINWTFIRALTLTSGDVSTTATINTAITPIVYTIGGSATGATVIDLPSGLIAVYDEGALTISGAPKNTGIFTYTVSTTNDCALATLKGTIVVSKTSAAAIANQGSQPQLASIANTAPSVTYADDVNQSRAAMITPNGDGKNDAWIIADIEKYPNNTVSIYNRSGTLVFKAHSYKNNWDGTYNGTPLNEDVYFYLLQLDDNKKQVRGTITIVREAK